MTALSFLDTNILVYAYNSDDPGKAATAQGLLRAAALGEGLISAQVLAEFASTLLHKTRPGLPTGTVREILERLWSIRVIAPDSDMVKRAVDARERYGIHFYDGMIVAAAERAKCARIWSEDLAPGQEYFGVRVENPFA